ncbi:hypothetical protein [Nonomuraea turkmeniaca]|uniref:hypothetical protein n=1 Tax=Nonomuraea turkmeniaca TaxID=103838 RepID=UPI001477160C|nr:hypothetical protein [Nonomuraea turkmeniaca]
MNEDLDRRALLAQIIWIALHVMLVSTAIRPTPAFTMTGIALLILTARWAYQSRRP